MGALDTPFLGIEVVGAVAQVLGKSQGYAVVGDEHDAARRGGVERYRFFAQIGYGLPVSDLCLCKGRAVECGRECQRLVGHHVLALDGAQGDAGVQQMQRLLGGAILCEPPCGDGA